MSVLGTAIVKIVLLEPLKPILTRVKLGRNKDSYGMTKCKCTHADSRIQLGKPLTRVCIFDRNGATENATENGPTFMALHDHS